MCYNKTVGMRNNKYKTKKLCPFSSVIKPNIYMPFSIYQGN